MRLKFERRKEVWSIITLKKEKKYGMIIFTKFKFFGALGNCLSGFNTERP